MFVYFGSPKQSPDLFGLPTQICEKCIKDLRAAYAFKSQCEKAFKQIESILYPDEKSQLDAVGCAFTTADGISSNEKSTQTGSQITNETEEETPEPATSNDAAVVCDICSKEFARLTQLRYHIRCSHPAEKKTPKVAVHSCDMCGMGFVKPAGLKKHIERMHSNPPPEKTEEQPVPDYSYQIEEPGYIIHETCDYTLFPKTETVVLNTEAPAKIVSAECKDDDETRICEIDALQVSPDSKLLKRLIINWNFVSIFRCLMRQLCW